MKNLKAVLALSLVTLLGLQIPAFAVGSGAFENASFGAADYGRGGASTAKPTNPATISINPAGLNELPGVQMQANVNFINMWTKIDSSRVNNGSTQSSATTVPVPTVYMSVNPGNKLGLNNRLAFGIGVDAPFGLSNKYDSNFSAVHYTGYRNWIKMYAIKPVASVRLADWLNIGAGPIWYRAFDVGQIAAYDNTAISAPAFPSGLGIGPTRDGQVRANMSGNAWGWHLGVLAKPVEKHQFGFYFRSPALIHLKGLLKGENILNGFTGDTSGKFETGIRTKLNIPMNLTWAYNYQITPKTDVEADLGWTKWSAFDNFYAPVDSIQGTTLGGLSTFHDSLLNGLFNTPGPGGVGDKDWTNSFTLNLGGEHKFTDRFRVRAGSYFYWTPIPKGHFTPVVPDANRLTLTLGLGYDLTQHLTFDAAYAAQFFMPRKVDNMVSESLGTSVDGTYKTYLHIWTAGLTYKFDATPESPKVEDWEGSTVKVG